MTQYRFVRITVQTAYKEFERSILIPGYGDHSARIILPYYRVFMFLLAVADNVFSLLEKIYCQLPSNLRLCIIIYLLKNCVENLVQYDFLLLNFLYKNYFISLNVLSFESEIFQTIKTLFLFHGPFNVFFSYFGPIGPRLFFFE